MAAIELKVPDIGDFKDVEIIEVLVKAGDEIVVEQSLITVESDKASMEIPASIAGRIVEMRVKLGDKISEGSVWRLSWVLVYIAVAAVCSCVWRSRLCRGGCASECRYGGLYGVST